MRRLYLHALLTATMMASTVVAVPCFGAKRTDVLDAADVGNPWDFQIGVEYSRSLKRAKITREFHCDASDPQEGNCVDFNEIIAAKEMRYTRNTDTLMFDLRTGIYHDLELFSRIPYIMSDAAELTQSSGVLLPTVDTGTTSSSLFNLPFEAPTRSGIGDVEFGVRWSPFNQQRDPDAMSTALTLSYLAPTGNVREGGDEDVGHGIHEVKFAADFSKRYQVMEPYFGAQFIWRRGANDSLFRDFGRGQTEIDPGNRIGFDTGVEIAAWEVPRKAQKLTFDIGLGILHTTRGRGYSEIFEGLSQSNCTTSRDCPAHRDFFSDPQDASVYPSDGITDIDAYTSLTARLGASLQLNRFVKFMTNFAMTHDLEHFITMAEPGIDQNGDGLIDQPGEYNPVYDPDYDLVGRRFRTEENTDFTISVGTEVTF